MAETPDETPVRDFKLDTLYNGWSKLLKAGFIFRRSTGVDQPLSREIYDCGDGAAVLLYNLESKTVVLTRQFRIAAYIADPYNSFLIEVAAGKLDESDPEERIRIESEEETGFKIGKIIKIFDSFMSPGSVSERVHMFIAPYSPSDKKGSGGGLQQEGEDIEVLEVQFAEAMDMIRNGKIRDAKTIMLLQHAALNLF